MGTLAPPFFSGPSSIMQVTSTTIKSQIWSKFRKFRPRTAELAALERLEKKTLALSWEKCCKHSSAFIFGRIFIILADNKDSHNSLDEFDF